MKVVILFLLVFLSATVSVAQVERTYAVDPSDTYITSTTVLDDVTKYYIHFKNITGAPLKIGWKRLSMDIPSAWDYSLCDLGTCYAGIPEGDHVMFTVDKDSSGFLAPNIYPYDIPGTATIRMAVWDKDHPSITDTLTWIITATTQSGVTSTTTTEHLLRTYPNPATGSITVDLDHSATGTLQLLTVAGVEVFRQQLVSAKLLSVDLSSLSRGEYIVVFTGNDGSTKRTTIIKY